MIRWYAEHPLDGQIVARSISVGLPADTPAAEDFDRPAQNTDRPNLGHVVPEADREVSRAPLSQARKSSIPAVDLDEMSSLKPVVLMSMDEEGRENEQQVFLGDYSSQIHLTSNQSLDRQPTTFLRRGFGHRKSLAPGGVDLNKPFGQSPFAEIIEVGWGEVSMSSQPKTLSRANLLASG